MHRLIIFVGAAVYALSVPSLASANDAYGCYYDFLKTDYKAAFPKCKVSAIQVDAKSQAALGVMYSKGQGVGQSYSEAMKWYRKAADQGFTIAQFNLGTMYMKGQGGAQSHSEAIKWYRKAADKEHAEAQFNLGNLYARGQGVGQSYSEAIKRYRKAADQGHAEAQFNLGNLYLRGQGVAQLYSEAIKWIRKAADQGHPKAQFDLGAMYAQGQGVLENYIQAYHWTSLAAASGNLEAAKNLEIIKDWLTPAQISEVQRLALGGRMVAQETGWSAISRADVKRVQKVLNDLGFNIGSADGVPGKRTNSALEGFQRIKGLPIGPPDAATFSALGVK